MSSDRVDLFDDDHTESVQWPARTEEQVALDVIAQLALSLLLRDSGRDTLLEVGLAVGVPARRIGEVILARKRVPYRPPSADINANLSGSYAPNGREPRTPTEVGVMDHAPRQGRSGLPSRDRKGRLKNPTTTTRRCGLCEEVLPLAQFRLLKGGHRKSFCLDCEREYQRSRYLHAKKEAALNAVGLAFAAVEGSGEVGLLCTVCGRSIEVGDDVESDSPVHLRHAVCKQRADS